MIKRGLTYWYVVWLFLVTAGCNKAPDPLAGFQVDMKEVPTEAIDKDYHDFIQHLPEEERIGAGLYTPYTYFKDDTGKHAIQLQIPITKVIRWYILYYDKDNKRIKVITFDHGDHSS